MKQSTSIAAFAAAILLAGNTLAMSPAEQRIMSATEVMQEFVSIPEDAIPSTIMRNAYGVVVIPSVIKVGFGFGGSWGKGILTVRQEDGSWSNPSFVRLGGGSIGWQIGAQSTDLVMVFKDRRSIDNIVHGKLTLGGQASAAAGPMGRSGSAATDGQLTAEIYSYSRNRGLFAGISLDGNWISMDQRANNQFYGNGMTPQQIMNGGNMPTPLAAQNFMEILIATAPGSRSISRSRTASLDSMPAIEAEQPALPEVETFPIEPLNGGGAETRFGDETTF